MVFRPVEELCVMLADFYAHMNNNIIYCGGDPRSGEKWTDCKTSRAESRGNCPPLEWRVKRWGALLQ